MPKKKLTKAQVKRKLKTMMTASYDLVLDKMGHPDSKVPMSLNKILELNRAVTSQFNRVK
jgi:hypothetical protein|tara:strand:- start:2451 stop:2630 length:180 start_codon:yes stop_codon:yes gene_type:complete